MKIQQLHISNFRCIRNACVDLRALTGFVGRNGAGKSTFLHALQLFYSPAGMVTPEDYYGNVTAEDITIRVTYGNLRPEEKQELAPYLDGETLTVTKRFAAMPADGKASPGKYFASTMAFPAFKPIRSGEMSATERREAYNKLISEGVIPADTPKAKKDADVIAGMEAFEAANGTKLVRSEMETQLFGEKKVGSGKLEKFTRFVYVPAVRDVSDEAEDKKASFAQLLDLVVTPKIQARVEVQQLPQQIQDLVRKAYDQSVIGPDLAALASDLNAVLKPLVGQAHLSFDLIPPEVRPSDPKIVPTVTEDNFAGDLSRKGHGLQRAIIFTVLSHLARIRTTAASGMEAQPDLILAIEEPELYQHPSRCRQIARVLRELSDAATPGNQVLFTTHSPYFLDIEHFEDVRIVRKSLNGGCAAESTATKLTFDDIRIRWAECCAIDADKVTRNTIGARLTRPFLTNASEGFFADFVVLVEGAGDAALLTRLAERMNKSWDAQGIVVISTDGKANLGAPWLVFKAFTIPTYVVFDGDLRHKGCQDEGASVKLNEFLQRAGGIADPAPFPQGAAGVAFACFEDEVEIACVSALSQKAFDEVRNAVAVKIACRPNEVLKNATGAALFVDEVYAANLSLPFAEAIVNAISAAATSETQQAVDAGAQGEDVT